MVHLEITVNDGETPSSLLVPQILPQDALLNKTVEEIQRQALEEAERVSPKHTRGKGVERRGYANYRFLKNFTITVRGRRVTYKPHYTTVKLPVLYKNGKRIKTRVEQQLERESSKVLETLLLTYSVLGGKLNQKLPTPQLNIKGDYKYIIIDGKYVKLTHGEKGVLIIAIGITPDGKRAVLDITLVKEEDKKSYWEFLVSLWKKYNVEMVVADGAKALDSAIAASGMKVKRQYCVVHLKRNMTREEREELDKLMSSAEKGVAVVDKYGVFNYIQEPKELWKWLKSNNLVESFNSLVERRRFGKSHTPRRVLQTARAIAIWYNLFTNFFTTVIILQLSLLFSLLSTYLGYLYIELY